MQASEFKINLIGPSHSGKTRFVDRLVNRYGSGTPTLGVNVTIYQLDRKTRLSFWDCAGDPNYQGLGKGYLQDSDLVVVFGNDPHFQEWVPPGTPWIQATSTLLNDIRRVLVPRCNL